MRLKRLQSDFRVFEVLDEELLGDGEYQVYRVTKRGLTTFEAAELLAREANVERADVQYAGLKDKDGITGQFMSVKGGRKVSFKNDQLTIRPAGRAPRALDSGDNQGNSFEIVVRDLASDDMRRIRVNLDQVKRLGLPSYYDDQRFGCLRHGQGFLVRKLVRGDLEGAARDLLCAPSRYGAQHVERYKAGIAERWGDWQKLVDYSRGRRGASFFAWLADDPSDFAGALVRGVASHERTIHLFAYQSHLWNRAAALWVKNRVDPEQLAWLPGDDGALPVYRALDPEVHAEFKTAVLPLYGRGVELDREAARLYDAVFRSEGIEPEDFLALDLPGFRPVGEPRALLLQPQFLRAAPAERDDLYTRKHKMRLRFTLPRGQYATLVSKRLAMQTERGEHPPRLWVSRHPMDYPDDEGRMRAPRPLREPSHRGPRRDDRRFGGRPDDDRRGDSRRDGAPAPGRRRSEGQPARPPRPRSEPRPSPWGKPKSERPPSGEA